MWAGILLDVRYIFLLSMAQHLIADLCITPAGSSRQSSLPNWPSGGAGSKALQATTT
jgi:hypothetical protein